MSYRPIRKDLITEKQKCHFCSRTLNSLKAYVLENTETKEIIYAGFKCAGDNIDSQYKLGLIPDFTRYTLAMSEREVDLINPRQGNEKADNTTSDEDEKRRNALEYIELREDKLVEDFKTSYPILKTYFDKHLVSELNDNEIKHIFNIEKNAPETLKLMNLQKCYNYLFWIDVAIGKLGDDSDKFLKSVRKYLIINKGITEDQKVAVNKWIVNLSNVPQLK